MPATTRSPTFTAPPAAAPVASGSAKGKKTTAAKGDYSGPRCQYKFMRGAREGQECGDPCVPGEIFCKQCVKKKSAASQAGGAAPASSSSSSSGGFSNSKSAASSASAADQGFTLNVQAIKDRNGYYRTTGDIYTFIVQQLPNGDVVARGIEEDGKTRPMTAEEKLKAEERGLLIVDDESPPAQTMPPAPISSTVSRPSVIPRSH